MSHRTGLTGLLVGVPLLLAGCASTSATAGYVVPATSMAPGATMAPGMSMAPGATMAPGMSMPAATSPRAKSVSAGSPSKSAAMICGQETRTNVQTLMGQHTPPPTRATWVDHLYTCTYQLPGGNLVLSVKESPNAATARGYFNSLRRQLGHTTAVTGLAGLGLPAYEKATGTVVFLKDNTTLKVDATALPHQVGPQHSSHADLAYTVATDVLACWTGK